MYPVVRVGGGVPGVGYGWVGLEGAIPVPHPGTIPGPIFNIFKRLGPTYGQMKAFSKILMRFPRIGSRMTPELTSE